MRGVKVQIPVQPVRLLGRDVTSRDNVKTLKDLEGKELAGARATTNYQMFEFFAKQQGVDISKFKVVNTATPGLVSYAHRGSRRRDPALGTGLHADAGRRSPASARIDLNIAKTWKAFSKAAHAFRISASPRMPIGPMRTRTRCRSSTPSTRRRRSGSPKNPDEAAPLILPKSRRPRSMQAARRHDPSNDRLGDEARRRGEIRKDIQAVYKAGMDINYLPSMPSDASIYDKPLK